MNINRIKLIVALILLLIFFYFMWELLFFQYTGTTFWNTRQYFRYPYSFLYFYGILLFSATYLLSSIKKYEKYEKNYNKLIKDKESRKLSSAGYRLFSKCFDIVCKQRNLTIYHKETKPLRDKLMKLMEYLIIDKEMSKKEIKDLIKNKKIEL